MAMRFTLLSATLIAPKTVAHPVSFWRTSLLDWLGWVWRLICVRWTYNPTIPRERLKITRCCGSWVPLCPTESWLFLLQAVQSVSEWQLCSQHPRLRITFTHCLRWNCHLYFLVWWPRNATTYMFSKKMDFVVLSRWLRYLVRVVAQLVDVLSKSPIAFPIQNGWRKATTKWVFMGHFVVRPPCEKVVQGQPSQGLPLWRPPHRVHIKYRFCSFTIAFRPSQFFVYKLGPK